MYDRAIKRVSCIWVFLLDPMPQIRVRIFIFQKVNGDRAEEVGI